MFLHQSVLNNGLPFNVEIPKYNKETLAAAEEGRRIAHDKSIKGYSSIEELNAALNDD